MIVYQESKGKSRHNQKFRPVSYSEPTPLSSKAITGTAIQTDDIDITKVRPSIHLPVDGNVMVRLPYTHRFKNVFPWLRHTLNLQSEPVYKNGTIAIPRTKATLALELMVDKFNTVTVYRDASKLTKCNESCQTASGAECVCSCNGLYHAVSNNENWYTRDGDVLWADLGEFRRTATRYTNRDYSSATSLRKYNREMYGMLYTSSSRTRNDVNKWHHAELYWCACCHTAKATVWDHCHTHYYVRAPLCRRCNTRFWKGWDKTEFGRIKPDEYDLSYLELCPYSDGKTINYNYVKGECTL